MDLNTALTSSNESEKLDFKESFDTDSKGEWCEIIKDIVAMANSGGGLIIIGANDNGTPTGFDVSSILSLDPADVTNKIFSYTGQHFSKFSIVPCEKKDNILAAIQVDDAPVPIVFIKPGNYQTPNGKQKNAFSVGSVYFRHGAKSEPCTSNDLQGFLQREIERVKHSWLDGIKKVVEAPQGSKILVVSDDVDQDSYNIKGIRLADDPNAPEIRVEEEDFLSIYPLSYKELTNEMRDRYKDFLENQKYHRIRKSLEDNPTYCKVRLLNPNNPNGSKTFLFSENIFEEFDKHYTKRV